MVVSEQTGTNGVVGSPFMKDAVATQKDVAVGEQGTSSILFQPEDIAFIEPKDGYRGILKKGPFEGSVPDSPVSDDTSYRDNYYIIPVPCQITWTILSATDEYVEMDYNTPDGTYAYIQVNKETGAYHIMIKSPDGSYVVIDADPTKGTISEMYYDTNGNPVVGTFSTGTTNFWTHLYTITNNLICKHFMTADEPDTTGPGPVQGVSAEISTFPMKPGNSPVEPKDGFWSIPKDGIDVGPLSEGDVSTDTSLRDNYYIIPVPCQVSWTILSTTDEYVEMDYTTPDGTYIFIRIDKGTGAYHIIIKSPDGSFTVIDADPVTGIITSTTHNPNGIDTMGSVVDTTNFWTMLYSITKHFVCDTASSNLVENEELEYKIDTSGKASVLRFDPGDSVLIEPREGFVTFPKGGNTEIGEFGPIPDIDTDPEFSRDDYYIIPVPCQVTWTILSVTDDYVELEYTAPDGTYAYIQVKKKTGAYYILITSPDGSYTIIIADPQTGTISEMNYDANGNPFFGVFTADTTNFWTYLYKATKRMICDKAYSMETFADTSDTETYASGKVFVRAFEPGDSVPIEPGDGFATIPKDGDGDTRIREFGQIPDINTDPEFSRDDYYIIPVPCQITWTILTATDDYVELEYTAPDGTYAYIKVDKKSGAYYIHISSPDGSYTDIYGDPATGLITSTTHNPNGIDTMSAMADINNFWTYLYKSTKALICDKASLFGYTIETEPVGLTGGSNTPESRSTSDGCEDPDLMVTDLSFPERTSAGEEITLTFTVINTGNSPSPMVPFRISLPRLQTIDPQITIPALNPDETTTITTHVVIPINGDGFGQLRIIIDPDDTVRECNELDNSDGGTFTVLAKGVTPEEYDRLTTPEAMGRASSGGSSGGGTLPFMPHRF